MKLSEDKRKNGGQGLSRMSLNDHKAGMEGLDREKINAIIHDASKGLYIVGRERWYLQYEHLSAYVVLTCMVYTVGFE